MITRTNALTTALLVLTVLLALTVTSLTLAAPDEPELAQSSLKIVGIVWEDTNCDGIRQDGEPLLPTLRVTLRHAGDNGQIDGFDRNVQESTGYGFFYGAAGSPYFIAFQHEHKPAGYVPAPFRQGGDPTRDNDMTVGLLPGTSLWATPVFWMPADGSQVTGIDIGLCKLVLDEVVYLPLVVR